LGPKISPIRKRSGEVVHFSAETVAVAEAMLALKLNPERAVLRQVLAVAVQVLGIGVEPIPDIKAPGQ
jgi:hypothetical protein